MKLEFFLSAILAINMIVGILFFARSKNRLAHYLFALLLLSVNIWILSLIIAVKIGPEAAKTLAFIFGVLIFLSLLLFAHFFPRVPKNFRWHHLWYIVPMIAYIGIILFKSELIVYGDEVTDSGITTKLGPLFFVLPTLTVSYIVSAFTVLIYRIRKENNVIIKTQLKYITFAIASFLVPMLVTNIILPGLGIFKYNIIAPAFSIPMVVLITYAISHYRFFDLHVALKKVISYVTIFMLSLGLATILISENSPFFYLKNETSSAIIFILAVFYFEKTFHFAERLAGKLVPSSERCTQLLHQLGETLSSTLNLSEIIAALNQQIPSALKLQNNGQILLRTNHYDLQNLNSAEAPSLHREKSLIKYFEEHPQSLSLDEIQANLLEESRHTWQFNNLKESFKKLKANIIVPLRKEKELIGLYIIEKINEDDQTANLLSSQRLKDVEEFLNDIGSTAICNAQKYQSLQNRFKEISEEENEMIQSMYHEFNTPLSIIKGNLELLRLQTKDREFEELNELEVSLKSVTDVTNRMIETIHMDKVDLKDLKTVKVEVSKVMNHILKSLAPGSKNIEHKKKVASIMGVEELIEKLFMEILKKAMFYAKSAVCIRYEKTEDQLKIIIENDGPKIEEKDLKNVFNKFYRSDRSRTKQTGGAGLGLTLAYKIAKKHGGAIEIENMEPVGVRVTTSLPM
ncbi:hypothetical protein IPJ72_02030 [Candidatus Peregrinibacteria bacterium]|nr:MAG: hypothetical protein IPJ72_02030 [Candidatus Peregrinibacteria bacterium]